MELLENVCLDRGANGAKEGIGILLVTNVCCGGELGKESRGRFGIGVDVEARQGGAGSVNGKAALGARFAEKSDGLVVGMGGAEVDDEFAVFFGKKGELAFRFCIHICQKNIRGVGQIRTYPFIQGRRKVTQRAQKGKGTEENGRDWD